MASTTASAAGAVCVETCCQRVPVLAVALAVVDSKAGAAGMTSASVGLASSTDAAAGRAVAAAAGVAAAGRVAVGGASVLQGCQWR